VAQWLISFTFDDFLKSVLAVRGSILEGYGARGTHYTSMSAIRRIGAKIAHRWKRNIDLTIKVSRAVVTQPRYAKLDYISKLEGVFAGIFVRECPICRYVGYFSSFGHANRPEALCPQCGSLERHRLLYLATKHHERCMPNGKDVLHFAPEPCIRDLIKGSANVYIAVDLPTKALRDKLDLALDITAIGLCDRGIDLVISCHVLDQVSDDAAAFKEIFRILRSGGAAIFSVPIIEGWDRTFEDDNIRSPRDRLKYFGLEERVRWYGRDFVTRLKWAGLSTYVFQPTFQEYVRYGLMAGDKIYIGVKP
jgi:hypothetical protein